jgi:hypothetical protein
MAKSSKRTSIKLTPGKVTQLKVDIADLRATYGALAGDWGSLSPAQRAAVLRHSPMLAELVELVTPFTRS